MTRLAGPGNKCFVFTKVSVLLLAIGSELLRVYNRNERSVESQISARAAK